MTPRNTVLAILALLYVLSPLDLIPDWVFPFVGWLDDLGILSLVALWIFSHRGKNPPEPEK